MSLIAINNVTIYPLTSTFKLLLYSLENGKKVVWPVFDVQTNLYLSCQSRMALIGSICKWLSAVCNHSSVLIGSSLHVHLFLMCPNVSPPEVLWMITSSVHLSHIYTSILCIFEYNCDHNRITSRSIASLKWNCFFSFFFFCTLVKVKFCY